MQSMEVVHVCCSIGLSGKVYTPVGWHYSLLIIVINISGRLPALMSKNSSVVYGLSFFGAFLTGMVSYNKTCLQKLLTLENSVLAEHYRNAMKRQYVR